MNYTLMFGITFILSFILLGVMHEQVHIIIYNSYGINAHAEYLSHFPDFVTIADEPCPTEFCTLAHNLNEAITYPLEAFYLMIAFGLFFIIMQREEESLI